MNKDKFMDLSIKMQIALGVLAGKSNQEIADSFIKEKFLDVMEAMVENDDPKIDDAVNLVKELDRRYKHVLYKFNDDYPKGLSFIEAPSIFITNEELTTLDLLNIALTIKENGVKAVVMLQRDGALEEVQIKKKDTSNKN